MKVCSCYENTFLLLSCISSTMMADDLAIIIILLSSSLIWLLLLSSLSFLCTFLLTYIVLHLLARYKFVLDIHRGNKTCSRASPMRQTIRLFWWLLALALWILPWQIIWIVKEQPKKEMYHNKTMGIFMCLNLYNGLCCRCHIKAAVFTRNDPGAHCSLIVIWTKLLDVVFALTRMKYN